jgi:hypothetical protein
LYLRFPWTGFIVNEIKLINIQKSTKPLNEWTRMEDGAKFLSPVPLYIVNINNLRILSVCLEPLRASQPADSAAPIPLVPRKEKLFDEKPLSLDPG